VARSARTTFVLLFALMAIDFADRQVLVSAFPYLRAEWGLTDTELGALVSVLALTVALGALPTAVLVDRWSRVRAIALMGSVWSVAAAASGLAQGYGQLLAARMVVGAGEAGYGPAGGALLATAYPASRRATALGAFQAAGPLGTVVGAAVGSAVAALWGWRWAVALFALPGLLVALLVLLVPDYPTVRPARPGVRAAAVALLRARSAVGAVLGGTLLLIIVSAFYTWLPTQLERAHGLLPAQAGALTAVFVLSGVVGTIAWALTADRQARRDCRRRLTVPAVAALATVALLGTAFAAQPPTASQLALVLVGGATATAAVGPVAAVVIDVVHPGLRATAVSVLVVLQAGFGLAVGPVLAGALADLWGLGTVLATVPVLGVPAAAAFWWGSRAYPLDRHAPAAVTSEAAHPADGVAPAADRGVRGRTARGAR
jgi:MFS family permease